MSILAISGLIVAFLFGIWWGLPTRYDQPLDDIEERLGEEGQHQKVRRRTTPLTLLQRTMEKGSDRRRTGRRGRTPFRF